MAIKLFGISFKNPLPMIAQITSGLGDPRPYGEHEGYDLSAPTGTRIMAAAPGTVSQAGYMPDGYGYYMEIDHGSGVKSLYGHMMSKPLFERGAQVQAGQTIGYVGSTGYSTGPHLHFHIVADGIYQDVVRYVDLAVAGAREFLRQGELPCADAFKESREAWEACMLAKFGYRATDELYEQYASGEMTPEDFQGIAGEGLAGVVGDFGLSAWWETAKTEIEDLIYNIVFAPAKAIVSAFKLSDAPLEDGRATLEWLQTEENTALLVTSIALTLLGLLLLVVAVNAFLTQSSTPISTAVKLVESPLSTVTEAAGV